MSQIESSAGWVGSACVPFLAAFLLCILSFQLIRGRTRFHPAFCQCTGNPLRFFGRGAGGRRDGPSPTISEREKVHTTAYLCRFETNPLKRPLRKEINPK